MADALAGVFGPQVPDPLQGVFGGNSDFAAASESPLAPPPKKPPTPLLNAVEGGQGDNAPQPDQMLQDIFAAPQVHPSKKDAGKVAALEEQQHAKESAESIAAPFGGQVAQEGLAEAAGAPAEWVGQGLAGIGDWLQRVQTVVGNSSFAQQALKNPLTAPITAAILNPSIAQAASTSGAALQGVGQTIESAVPEEHQQRVSNQLANLFGGMAGLVATGMVGGSSAALPQLLGQGFDQINQTMSAKTGTRAPGSAAQLTAETAGGVAVAALNATGLGVLLTDVSLPIKNAIVRGLTSAAMRGGADAATFAAQGITTQLASQLGIDPSTPVSKWGDALKGAGQNAAMGGLIGAVFGAVSPHGPSADIAIGEPQPLDLSMAKVFSPDASYGEQSMARGAPLVTPEDHASPLPTDLIQQGKGAMDIDLNHPFDTKLASGKTVQQTVDEALGKPADVTPVTPVTPPEPTGLPDETVTNAAHPSQAPEGEMDRRVGALSQGLTSRGIDPTIADGIAAGIIAESGGDLTAHNKDSGAYGLGQWLGSRRDALFQKYGPNPTFDQQMDFLVSELKGGDPGGKFVLGASNPADALDAYITKFMRPAAGYETDRDLTAGEKALGMKKRSGEAQAQASPEPGLGEVSTTFEPLNVPTEEAAAQPAPDELQPFKPEDQSLGVPRADMPQIKSEDHGALTNFINARDISHTSETVDPNTLKPTQAEFNPAKVEDMLGIKGDRSILVSSDGYILDGTHQWLADQKSGEPSQIIRFDAPITDLISLAHEFPSSRPSEENATEAQTHPAVEPFAAAQEPFNSEAFDKQRADTIAASRAQGNVHLDQLSPTVEDMRGKQIYYAHDPNITGTVRTVANTGEVVVHWNDPYSAEKEMAATKQYGGKTVQESWLQPSDLKDYVVANPSPQDALKAKIAAGETQPQATPKGPAPAARPRDFFQAVADHLAQRTKQAGVRVRISAEDAISHGVPADEIFINPKAKYPTVKLRMAKVFATTKAPLNSKAAPARIVSLDDLGDRFDAEQFGAQNGDGVQANRMSPETAGDLLARSLARDDTALDQHDKRYEAYQREKDETANEYAQGAARERLEELAQQHDLKLNEDEYQNAMDYLARGTSHEYALAATVRDAAARAFDEDAARFGNEWPKEIASDLYEGENAEPRGGGDEEALNEPGAQHGRAAGEAPHGGQPEAGLGAGERSPNDRAERPVGEAGNAIAEPDERAGTAEHGRQNGPPETASVLDAAPEGGASPEALKDIVTDYESLRQSQGEGDEQITHIFDPPAKGDIVRLNDKSRMFVKDHGWLTKEQAQAKIREWEDHAVQQGKETLKGKHPNADKVVLSFFDLSGEWSLPWEQAGYEVWRFDIQHDKEMGDVNNFSSEFFSDWFGDFEGKDVYAILAANPCTDFASSGARHFAAKDADGRTVSSVKLVHQTLAAIEYFKPAIWAMENPVGRIEKLGGLPPWRLSFDPNDVGDPYTKKTLIWGRFNGDLPIAPVEPVEGSKMHKLYGGKSLATKNARSVTPEGFSYSFFMGNNAVDHPEMAVANKYDRLDPKLIADAIHAGASEEDIDHAVEDHYYQELDDEAGNQALRELAAEKGGAAETPAEKPKVSNAGVDAAREQGQKAAEDGKARSAPSFLYDPEHKKAWLEGYDAAKGETSPEEVLGPRSSDTGEHLQRKADEPLKPKAEQKPVGSDGGLFDTQDTTGDLFANKPEGATKAVTPDPVEKAKATLQQALDELNGKPQSAADRIEAEAKSIDEAKAASKERTMRYQPDAKDLVAEYLTAHGKPTKTEDLDLPHDQWEAIRSQYLSQAEDWARGGRQTPEERGLKPLFDSEEPTKQVGFFDEQSGKPELTDVGEKIGGARKDLWAERGLALSDLEGMSQGEAHKFVTKDNVWPKPKYEELDVPPEVAASVKLLRDSLAAKPRVDSAEGRKNYVEAMTAARKVLDETKTPEDVRSVQRRLYDALGVDNSSSYSRHSDEQKAARAKLFSIFKGRTAHFQIDYGMRRKVEQMVAQGWPGKAIEPWTRRFNVRPSYDQTNTFRITDKKGRTLERGLPTQEAAEAKAKELYEGLNKNPDGTKKAPTRPHLDKLERTGKDIRNGRDVQPEEFLNDFGFRGVEYGNWAANDERQKATNLGYEALHDLADTLQIPPETLSLGGQLGLAFGARGSGSAAAHYEPGKLVINLTKLRGAGTLAHEWGHALDHYFGSLDSELGTRGAPDYASGGRKSYNFKALGSLRPDLAEAFDGVMQALFKRDKTRAEVVRDAELKIEQLKAGIARQEQRLAEASKGNHPSNRKFIEQSKEWIGYQQTALKRYGQILADARDESVPLKPEKVDSSFFKSAKLLSGKAAEQGYWARPTEMFARSFEAYVNDKIAERGNKSQYLVHNVGEDSFPAEIYGANPYPTGDERKAINAAYDKLFQTVETRSIPQPREGGPTKALGQAGDVTNPAPVFYSALERGVENMPTKRASADQWLATIKRTPGVKAEELEWSGVEDWLKAQPGPVEKEALLGVIRDHGIKVDEVVLGGPIPVEQVERSPTLRGIMRDIRDEWVERGMRHDRERDLFPQAFVNDELDDRPDHFVVYAHRQRLGGDYDNEEIGRYTTRAEAQREFLAAKQRFEDEHRAKLEQQFNELPYEQQIRGTQLETHSQFSHWSSDSTNPTYRELLITLPRGEGGNPERAPSTHWDTEAVVAHTRFMDKTDADGRKVLFVEEVQSDWHQKGRDQGYEQPVDQLKVEAAKQALNDAMKAHNESMKALVPHLFDLVHNAPEEIKNALANGAGYDTAEAHERFLNSLRDGTASYAGSIEGEALATLKHVRAMGYDEPQGFTHAMRAAVEARDEAALREREAQIAYDNATEPAYRGIPDAPFKSSWPALVMKRIIRWAVDNGYDKVAWTTGQEQAERYNLEKHISRINLTDNSSGGIGKASLEGPTTHGHLRAFDSHSRQVLDQYVNSPEELHGIIGKELAEKLLAAEPQQHREAGMGLRLRQLEGLDLRTGGEGMKGFYDRNLVNITNDLIKKYGGKVEPVGIGANPERAKLHEELKRKLGQDQILAGFIANGDQARSEADRYEKMANEGIGDPEKGRRWAQKLREAAGLFDARAEAEKGMPHAGFELTDKLKEAASSGLPLFKRGGEKIELTPEQEMNLKSELQDQLSKMVPGDRVALDAASGMSMARGDFHGQYWLRAIKIALDRADKPFETLAHETYHAVGPEGIQLLTKTEYNMVNDAGWKDPLVRGQVLAAYPDEPPAVQREEAGAYWIQKQWARQNGSLAQRIIGRLKGFFSALRNAAVKALGGTPGRSAEDVARDLFSGKLGERPEGSGREPGTVRGRQVNVTFGRKPLGQAEDERPIRISDSHPDRLFKPVRAVLDAIRDGTSEAVGKAIDNFRTEVQDRMLPVLRTQASVERMLGRKITEDENPYLAEELFHGRVGARLDNLSHDFVEPIFAQMREAGIKPEEFDSYLYARHAPERNERISQINPKFANDLLGKGKAGSGMTNEEAASIMRDVAASGKQPIFESMAEKVDGMLKQALDTRLESGLLSPEEAAAWRRTYKNYVPLRGLPGDEETEGSRINRASGFTVKGKESRMAFGRVSKAQDILAHSILQADEAIIRSEQNEVAKALGALAKAAPDKSFWQVDKIRKVPVFNKSTGQVSYRSESRIAADDAPYTVSYKEGGTEHRVVFNHRDPTAKRTAAAMRNLNVQQMHFIVRTVGAINRLLSKMYTSFVPEFVISNGFRDLQSAAFYLPAQDLKGLTTKVAKDYPAALVAATKGSFGKEDTSDWGKWHREFRMSGGHTAFNDMRSVADLQREIAAATKMRGPLHPISMGKALLHVVENTNDGVENALRLATFKNARELGATPKQAASLAKNVTVNFNRKGTIGPVLNTLYLFFNASIQDDARILMLLGKSRKVQAFAASMVALGYAMQMMNTARSDKDKDGDLFYNKINEYDQERNLIIMVDGKNYIKIPLQWGLNTFPNFGRMLARMYQGERPMKALGDFTNATLDSFSPVGAGRLVETMMPTIARPVVDLTENRDYADRPIMPDEKEPGHQVPNTQRYWQSVPPYDKALTDFMGKLTGGDNVRPGAIDISPETLHYLSNQVFGGVGTFFANLASMGSKALSNDPTDVIEKNEIPFERRVYGSKPAWYDRAAYLARVQEIQQEVSYAETYLKEGNLPGARSMVGSPDDLQLLKLAPAAQAAQDAMNDLHKQLGELENAQAAGRISAAQFKADKLKLQQSQQQVVDAFNTIYLRNVSKPTRP